MNTGLLSFNTSNLPWPVVALAIVTILYVAVIRPMLKRRPDPLEKLPKMGLAHERDVERQMNNLLVELSEMARQVSAQLDTRSAKLELLIQQADERIAQLSGLSSGQPAGGDPSRPAAAPPPAAPPAQDERYAAIYQLADEGRSAQDIARHLNRPAGEVELILALRARG